VSDEPPEPPAGWPPPPRRRRWPWAVAWVLAALAVVGASAVAVDQRAVATQWRDRAATIEAQQDVAASRTQQLELQRDELVQMLDVSERDVAALEARIRELADEKAQAEDTATTVQVERDVLAQVSGRIATAIEALDQCVTRMFDLQQASVDAFNRAAAGEDVDVEPLNAQAQSTTAFCNEARAAAAGAAAAADEIRR
jgi:chromosome segregation ATPase